MQGYSGKAVTGIDQVIERECVNQGIGRNLGKSGVRWFGGWKGRRTSASRHWLVQAQEEVGAVNVKLQRVLEKVKE